MIQLTKGTTVDVIVTATEKVTLTAPYFLWVFTNPETDNTVTWIVSSVDDQSPFPERYNDFNMDVDVVFFMQPEGQWHYKIYEQDNDTNTDPTLATTLVEQGMLILNKAAASIRTIKKFAPTAATIKVFNETTE